MNKKYIIPLIAFFTFVLGMVSMALPFLPFGWFLIFVTALLLLPYVPIFEKAFRWLARRDKSGVARKAGEKVSELYRWAGDFEKAEHIENTTNEATPYDDEPSADKEQQTKS